MPKTMVPAISAANNSVFDGGFTLSVIKSSVEAEESRKQLPTIR
jgi:hypothetical protein